MWRGLKRLFQAVRKARSNTRHSSWVKASSSHTSASKADYFSDSDIQEVADSAQRLVDVVNESLELAKTALNVNTKLSRLGVAKQRLEELKRMVRDYPFLQLYSLDEFEAEIAKIEDEFATRRYAEISDANEEGGRLEKEGKTEEAIAVYTKLAEMGTDTPFTYRRLAIFYRKQKDVQKELGVLRLAMENVPSTNAAHYQWFEDRYKKLQSKQMLNSGKRSG